MPDYQSFRTKQLGPVTLVRPAETEIVTRECFNQFTDELLDYVKVESPRMVVLALEQVSRYSSEAIGGLLRVRRHVVSYGGEVKLCMDNTLRKVFKITNLDGTLFDIHESVSEAVAAYFNK